MYGLKNFMEQKFKIVIELSDGKKIIEKESFSPISYLSGFTSDDTFFHDRLLQVDKITITKIKKE
jgi:hypothetical protein